MIAPICVKIHMKKITGGYMMQLVFMMLLFIYTAILLALSHIAKRRTTEASQFLDGGRQFGWWTVFYLMTAMWGASMFSVEIDTAFTNGFSAIWFGISTILSTAFIALFLLKPFRQIGYLTNSNLIGKRYGRKARNISALVIGLTFPIFAMKNVLAAASFLHVILGWNLPLMLIATTLVVIVYVSLGGLFAIAYVQLLNLGIFTLGLAVAAFYLLRNSSVMSIPVHNASHFHSITGVGISTIFVWIGMSLLNSVGAQAEFQTISAAKSTRIGKWGVYLSSIVLLFFALIPTLLGMVTREHVSQWANGLVAFPHYLETTAPPFAVVLVGLGFWAAALIWCAPLMFSGASSFGLDLFHRQGQSHDAASIRKFTRWSMYIQGALIVGYALLRPEHLAWWAVFGLTLRNAAIVGPTITFLLWPMVQERTILWSMTLGVSCGFGWNALTSFSATQFVFDINPMWIGTGVSLLVIVFGTLLENRGQWMVTQHPIKQRMGVSCSIIGLILFMGTIGAEWEGLHTLLGAGLFMSIFFWFFTAVFLTEQKKVKSLAILAC